MSKDALEKPEKPAATGYVAKPAYSLDELLGFHPGGRTKLYEAIKDEKLVARKQGRQTIVLATDYFAYLEGLPRIGGDGKGL